MDMTYHGKALDDSSQSPDDYTLNQVDPVFYFDTQVRFFPSDDWQLYVGVDNIFNKDPSYCPTCKNEPSPGSHYTGGQYRPWKSRFFYGGVKWSFGKD